MFLKYKDPTSEKTIAFDPFAVEWLEWDNAILHMSNHSHLQVDQSTVAQVYAIRREAVVQPPLTITGTNIIPPPILVPAITPNPVVTNPTAAPNVPPVVVVTNTVTEDSTKEP